MTRLYSPDIQRLSDDSPIFVQPVQPSAPDVRQTTHLGEMLRVYREWRGISLRALEPETGLDHVTLHRLEQGHSLDAASWLRLQVWLLMPLPRGFFDVPGRVSTTDCTRLGEALRTYRDYRFLTLADVERATGVGQPLLYLIECGETCRADTWLKLQRWLFTEITLPAAPLDDPGAASTKTKRSAAIAVRA